MKKQNIVQVMKKEEIPQIMLVVFSFAALVSFSAALLAPLQLPKDQAVQYYTSDPKAWVGLILLIVVSIIITLLVGTCLLIWKLKWPSRE